MSPKTRPFVQTNDSNLSKSNTQFIKVAHLRIPKKNRENLNRALFLALVKSGVKASWIRFSLLKEANNNVQSFMNFVRPQELPSLLMIIIPFGSSKCLI